MQVYLQHGPGLMSIEDHRSYKFFLRGTRRRNDVIEKVAQPINVLLINNMIYNFVLDNLLNSFQDFKRVEPYLTVAFKMLPQSVLLQFRMNAVFQQLLQ